MKKSITQRICLIQNGVMTEVPCPQGHTLKSFVANDNDWQCVKCPDRELPQGSLLFGCRMCDYDVCANCLGLGTTAKYQNGTLRRSGVPFLVEEGRVSIQKDVPRNNSDGRQPFSEPRPLEWQANRPLQSRDDMWTDVPQNGRMTASKSPSPGEKENRSDKKNKTPLPRDASCEENRMDVQTNTMQNGRKASRKSLSLKGQGNHSDKKKRTRKPRHAPCIENMKDVQTENTTPNERSQIAFLGVQKIHSEVQKRRSLPSDAHNEENRMDMQTDVPQNGRLSSSPPPSVEESECESDKRKETPPARTRDERATLRRKQRKLYADIRSQNNDLSDVRKFAFSQLSDKNNELFHQVAEVREGILDVENRVQISAFASKQAANIDTGGYRFSMQEFVNKLQERGQSKKSGMFGWQEVGVQSGACFHSVPPVDCLLGTFNISKTKRPIRNQRSRTRRFMGEASQLVASRSNSSLNEEKITKRIKDLHDTMMFSTTIKKLSDPNYEEPLDDDGTISSVPLNLFGLLCNDKSFTQTVENFMDFSFLVKEGKASLEVESGVPFTGCCKPRDADNIPVDGSHTSQLVVPLSKKFIKDVFELKEELDITPDCGVGHRKEGPATDYHEVLP